MAYQLRLPCLPHRLLCTTLTSLSQRGNLMPPIRSMLQVQKAYSNDLKIKKTNHTPRVLIIGGLGQLGGGLANVLRSKYGKENIILSDIKKPQHQTLEDGPYVYADVMDIQHLSSLVVDCNVDWLVHFSALLSAIGEQNFEKAMEINILGFHNAAEVSRRYGLRLFVPSTIGAFGPSTPGNPCPDITIQRPKTIYGVAKVHVELLGEYLHHKYGVDFRSVRLPGIISADTEPGGGTTDYAVDIFHSVMKTDEYKCFLKKDTRLPMMYLPDCYKGMLMCLEAPDSAFRPGMRTYNIQAISFTPEELVAEMKSHFPNMKVTYEPDERQAIAESWPKVLDDSRARKDLGWSHNYDLKTMVKDMIEKLHK